MTLKDEQKRSLFVRGQQMMLRYLDEIKNAAKEENADPELVFLPFYASGADYELIQKAFARNSVETWTDYQEKELGALSVIPKDSIIRFVEIAKCQFQQFTKIHPLDVISITTAVAMLGSQEPEHVLTIDQVLTRRARA